MNFWDNLLGDDDHAATYMESYGEGPGFELRHRIGALINDGESVLDVGCGPGWNLDHFQSFGPSVGKYRGLDYSERFVRVANERWVGREAFFATHVVNYQGEKNNNLSDALPLFRLGDVRNIEEPDKSWDVVILQDVLEHTNGYKQPIQEALRVAKKRVIITFWHLADSDSPHINDDGDDGWGAWYDKREWEKHLDSLGIHWLLDEAEIGNRIRHIYVLDKEIE
jgi:SAM-dependent methyltransferase